MPKIAETIALDIESGTNTGQYFQRKTCLLSNDTMLSINLQRSTKTNVVSTTAILIIFVSLPQNRWILVVFSKIIFYVTANERFLHNWLRNTGRVMPPSRGLTMQGLLQSASVHSKLRFSCWCFVQHSGTSCSELNFLALPWRIITYSFSQPHHSAIIWSHL